MVTCLCPYNVTSILHSHWWEYWGQNFYIINFGIKLWSSSDADTDKFNSSSIPWHIRANVIFLLNFWIFFTFIFCNIHFWRTLCSWRFSHFIQIHLRKSWKRKYLESTWNFFFKQRKVWNITHVFWRKSWEIKS